MNRTRDRLATFLVVCIVSVGIYGMLTGHSSITNISELLFDIVAGFYSLVTSEVLKKSSIKNFAGFSVRRLTDLAVLLAGRKRSVLREEWRAHLAGTSGHDPVTWRKVEEAIGFVVSGIQFRLADMADAAWIPADAILKSRKLSNLVVFGPTAMAVISVLRDEGAIELVKGAEGLSAIGFTLYGLIRVGRWWRDVRPPEPKAHRAKAKGE